MEKEKEIKQGEIVLVDDSRKIPHEYKARATADFNTNDEWYPLILEEPDKVMGLNTVWFKGEKLPCRKGMAKIKKIDKNG